MKYISNIKPVKVFLNLHIAHFGIREFLYWGKEKYIVLSDYQNLSQFNPLRSKQKESHKFRFVLRKRISCYKYSIILNWVWMIRKIFNFKFLWNYLNCSRIFTSFKRFIRQRFVHSIGKIYGSLVLVYKVI